MRVSLCLAVIAASAGCAMSHERFVHPTPRAPDGGPACAGTPPYGCYRGCTDVVEPQVCVDGRWQCAPGASTSLPPGCCGFSGFCYDAGPPDEGLDAPWAGDASTATFPCGWSDSPCLRYSQYCELSDVAICRDVPTACAGAPTCACVRLPSDMSCDDDGLGGITVHMFLGG